MLETYTVNQTYLNFKIKRRKRNNHWHIGKYYMHCCKWNKIQKLHTALSHVYGTMKKANYKDGEASLVAQMVKNCVQCRKPIFRPWVGEIPWRREGQSTPVFSPGELHGQKCLVSWSMGLQRVRHDWATDTHMRIRMENKVMVARGCR